MRTFLKKAATISFLSIFFILSAIVKLPLDFYKYLIPSMVVCSLLFLLVAGLSRKAKTYKSIPIMMRLYSYLHIALGLSIAKTVILYQNVKIPFLHGIGERFAKDTNYISLLLVAILSLFGFLISNGVSRVAEVHARFVLENKKSSSVRLLNQAFKVHSLSKVLKNSIVVGAVLAFLSGYFKFIICIEAGRTVHYSEKLGIQTTTGFAILFIGITILSIITCSLLINKSERLIETNN